MSQILSFMLISLIPVFARAEVADKEPALIINFSVSIASIAVALFLIKKRWWLLPASLILIVGAHLPILSEIYDRSVGPMILNELGSLYVMQPQVFLGFGFGASVVYAYFRRVSAR